MARRLVNMRLPEALLEATDARAKSLGQTRTMFVRRALEQALSGAPFPVGVENLTETPKGEVVKREKKAPAKYVQHRPRIQRGSPSPSLGRFMEGK